MCHRLRNHVRIMLSDWLTEAVIWSTAPIWERRVGSSTSASGVSKKVNMALLLPKSGAVLTGSRPAVSGIAGTRLIAPCNGTIARAQAKAGNWLPGSKTPDYLEDLPGYANPGFSQGSE